MAGRKVVGYNSEFTLVKYAWRSQHIESPFNGERMRAVVGKDTDGMYRAGVRTAEGNQVHTMFDSRASKNREEATGWARDMLRERLVDHARLAAEAKQKPGEIVPVLIEARALAIAEGRPSAAEKYGGREPKGCNEERERSL
jgi:hypothetical protein